MEEQLNKMPENELSNIFKERGQLYLRHLIYTLLPYVKRFKFFADDTNDEFQIVRNDLAPPIPQGIFKVWAAHVIPALEYGTESLESIETWRRELEKKPLSLYETLEQWRAFSEVFDRRLQQVFSNRDIPKDPEDAAVELFLRLKIAFALAAPFYNIEALVADTRENKLGNPINFAETSHGGKLDVVALLLPSALADHILAERLDWHSLSWEEIQRRIDLMRNDFLEGKETISAKQFILISRIANLAGVNPEEVLFAANALEFIPADVGGKKADLEQNYAISQLEKLLEEPIVNVGTNLVAKDINALIRFLNWFPAIRTPENFQGKFWRYDAVCATAIMLLEIVRKNPGLFSDAQFAEVFEKHLLPQLEEIDAKSAIGRFLLQLLEEGKFESLTEKINNRADSFIDEVTFALDKIKEQELLIDISQRSPTFLVGGKADGLRKAMQVFGQEVVLSGKVLTSELINEWLSEIDGIEFLVQQLNRSTNSQEKLNIGREIVRRIEEAEMSAEIITRIKDSFSGHRIVLRSSSFDEDAPIIGTAPGIYESVTDINADDETAISNALKTVISSFFSGKAISFREFKGLRHKPIFTVLVQEFVDNVGGTVFIEDGNIKINIASQPSLVNHLDELFEELFVSNSDGQLALVSKFLTKEQLSEIVWIARKAEEIFGSSDIEFVIDPETNRVKILQLRALQKHNQSVNRIETIKEARLSSLRIDDLSNLPNIRTSSGVNIIIDNSKINLNTYQGTLLRWLIENMEKIASITLVRRIPTTCHFANFVGCLGIDLHFSE